MTVVDGALHFMSPNRRGSLAVSSQGLAAPLTDAALVLRASAYQGSGAWRNEGTVGGTATTVTDNPSAPVWVPGAHPYWDIPITTPGVTDDEHGFTVADNAAYDISSATTIIYVTTPDVTGAASLKAVWKYTEGGSGLNNNNGWVAEEVDDIGGGAGSGGLIVACNDGDANGSGCVGTMISGRQCVVSRFDLTADTLTVTRNGSTVTNKFTSQPTSDISAISDASTTSAIFIGAGQNFESLAIWNRLLTDSEIALARNALGA